MTHTLVAIQSNYIPWKGYFDLIARADTCVLYDTVQYTKQDWRNRNQIKTAHGPVWLTIPVTHESTHQRICDTAISSSDWTLKHWHKITDAYFHAAHFKAVAPMLEALYERAKNENALSAVNADFIRTIASWLNIDTPIIFVPDLVHTHDKSETLIDLCKQQNAQCYLVGPAARSYLNEAAFTANHIQVEWMSYEGYPEYQQLYPPFMHQVSIIDLLVNQGDNARRYLLANAKA